MINSPNRNELITSHMATYRLVSFHRTNQWKVNHHMKKSLTGKLLLCNQRKVNPWKVKSALDSGVPPFPHVIPDLHHLIVEHSVSMCASYATFRTLFTGSLWKLCSIS